MTPLKKGHQMQQFVMMTGDGLFCPGTLSTISIKKCTGKCFLSVQCLSVQLFVVLLLRSQSSHFAVSGHPIYRNLIMDQFKGSTCPCHGWLHFALTRSPLLVILASSGPFSQSSSLHCPFPCYKRSHYSMSINLWKKSCFFCYGHELLLVLSWNKLGMSSVLNCEIA